MQNYTAQGSTTEEAIEKGLQALNISRDQADIRIIEEGKKGFLGIGKKDAVVQVTKKASGSALDQVLGVSENPLTESIKPEVEANAPAKEEKVEEKVEVAKAIKPEVTKETPVPVKEAIQTKAVESQEEKPLASEATSPVKAGPKDEASDQTKDFQIPEEDFEAIEAVRDYIKVIANAMGADDAYVDVDIDGNQIFYDIETEKAGIVIGRHGKVLNAIQSLAQVNLHKNAVEKLHATVDCESYRGRREGKIKKIARETADKVARTNQPVVLEAMPAYERKLVHRYLSRDENVQTHSEGKEPHRYLVVDPKINY